MSTFYGQVRGSADTTASRRGTKNSGIKVSAQSWEGSVITYMRHVNGKLMVDIEINDNDSSFYGSTVFHGTLEELKERLSNAEEK